MAMAVMALKSASMLLALKLVRSVMNTRAALVMAGSAPALPPSPAHSRPKTSVPMSPKTATTGTTAGRRCRRWRRSGVALAVVAVFARGRAGDSDDPRDRRLILASRRLILAVLILASRRLILGRRPTLWRTDHFHSAVHMLFLSLMEITGETGETGETTSETDWRN